MDEEIAICAHSGRIGHRFRDESAIYRSIATLVASYI
jgi:hypothetical protein